MRLTSGTLVAMALPALLRADVPAQMQEIATEFATRVRPILASHCMECHSAEKKEGELDLQRFATLTEVRQDPAVWTKVVEVIDNGEMPPKESKPLAHDDQKEILGWIDRYLKAEAKESAGDPGAVVLRRLTNAEYTYTIRDLTGVDLDPAKEFPADSAAGEGFTNTGSALVMSPALLQKYLDAGKEIARHAVLLPEGIRFSPSTTRGDWNNEILAKIRDIYQRHSEVGGAVQVNLQGVIFSTNDGGRIPIAKYLTAARDCSSADSLDPRTVADKYSLNSKYLGILTKSLSTPSTTPSLLTDLRRHWKKVESIQPIVEGIESWQQALTRFQNVGHMKSWMVPNDPLVARQEIRIKIDPALADFTKNPMGQVKLYLAASDAGDGNEGDVVLWENPRLVAAGRPDLLLRDVRHFSLAMTSQRKKLFESTAKILGAAAQAKENQSVDRTALAAKYLVDQRDLDAWFDYLGIGLSATSPLDLLSTSVKGVGGYDLVTGWGFAETPSVIANSSTSDYRVPGRMKGQGVCVHPSPTQHVALGWKSPIAGMIRITGKVTHAHVECGDGVRWLLDLRRASTRRVLTEGIAQGESGSMVGPIESIRVKPGDLVSLLVGPRGDHACDLTDIELNLTEVDGEKREWNLARDVVGNILAGNPHADSLGNEGVWHFYREKVDDTKGGPVIVAGSLLDRWQAATSGEEQAALASELETLLIRRVPGDIKADSPDLVLYRQLASLGGPLLTRLRVNMEDRSNEPSSTGTMIGLPASDFGKNVDGSSIEQASLATRAPNLVEVTLPAELAAGSEFVVAARLDAKLGRSGSVQVAVSLAPTPLTESLARGSQPLYGFTHLDPDRPVIVPDDTDGRQRFVQSFAEFRELFPAALCYYKIVPVDEVITLTLFHREDDHLRRLMLSDEESRELDGLWRELHFVSRDKLTMVDAFLQLLEYASQDGKPSEFEPFRQPIMDGAAAFKEEMKQSEPTHLASVNDLARRAFRRDLTAEEAQQLQDIYSKLRSQGIDHEMAIQLTLARVLVSPKFLYRLEQAPSGPSVAPVSNDELASRLSYFLWSSMPDAELRQLASQGKLHHPDILRGQVQRMLRDPKIRRLAQEFGCQWLQIYAFRSLDEKSERHFPEFIELRGDMEEEAVRFLTGIFQEDRSLMDLFDGDATYVNDRLAAFYGMANITGPEWRRVEGVKAAGRGSILGLAATLAKNSGASRTSPILRGTWISDVILGEKLPNPPKNVPVLPDEDSSTAELSVRQLVERHSSDEKCMGCHRRIDPYGFSLENYDAIGRYRTVDLAQHPIDAKTTLPDGTAIDGADQLRAYLLNNKRDVVLRQFLKKLLGYSLGRSVQLSDGPLLDDIETKLAENNYRFSVAVEAIVLSQPFRSIRGQDQRLAESP